MRSMLAIYLLRTVWATNDHRDKAVTEGLAYEFSSVSYTIIDIPLLFGIIHWIYILFVDF